MDAPQGRYSFSAVDHIFASVQHDVFFLSVFLSRVLANTGDEIQIDDLKLTGILLDDHAAVIDFLYHALHTAVV